MGLFFDFDRSREPVPLTLSGLPADGIRMENSEVPAPVKKPFWPSLEDVRFGIGFALFCVLVLAVLFGILEAAGWLLTEFACSGLDEPCSYRL